MTKSIVLTETKQSNLRPFKPGQSGNPKGRPRGARSKLSENFLNALEEDFAKHGPAAIEAARKSDPGAYLRIIASLVPKEFGISGDIGVRGLRASDLSDDDLAAVIAGAALTVASEIDDDG